MSPGDNQWLSEADFNCPGDGRMMLDGSARPKNDDDARIQKLHFDKVEKPIFNDEWDFVIDNYMYGANDPDVIDSVYAIAGNNLPPGADPQVMVSASPNDEQALAKQPPPKPVPAPVEPPVVKTVPPPPPEEPELPPLERVYGKEVQLPPAILKETQQKTVKATPKPLPPYIPKLPETPPVAVSKPPAEALPVPKPAPSVVVNKPTPPPVQPAPPVVVSKPAPPPVKPAPPVAVTPPPAENGNVLSAENGKRVTPPAAQTEPVALAAPEIKKKFTEREKVIAAEIPITADSIELRFYDNAEVDGDSISLFLNNQLLLQHIRLTDRPYIVKLSGDQLKDGNELTMVAENLGAIPPNTSYMVVFVNDQRYDATLASTEKSSAVVRFRRK